MHKKTKQKPHLKHYIKEETTSPLSTNLWHKNTKNISFETAILNKLEQSNTAFQSKCWPRGFKITQIVITWAPR